MEETGINNKQRNRKQFGRKTAPEKISFKMGGLYFLKMKEG